MAHRDGPSVRLMGVEQARMEHVRPVRGEPPVGRVAASTLIMTSMILAVPFIVTGYLAFAVLVLLPVFGLRALLANRTEPETEPPVVTPPLWKR